MSGEGTSDVLTVTGIVSLLGVLGAAVRWAYMSFTGRLDKRQADMDAREARGIAGQEARIGALEAKLAVLSDQVDLLTNRVATQRTAITLLVSKIQRDEPTAPELQMVAQLLGPDFPGFRGMWMPASPELDALLGEIDEKRGAA